MTTITLPEGSAWVAASLLSTAFLLQWQSIKVSLSRGKAKIDYPRMYATKEEQAASKEAMVFNCTQRAHQNTLENLPALYLTTLLTAVQYPKFAAAMAGTWTLGRVIYTIGYSSGSPSKRGPGFNITAFAGLGLLLASTKVVYDGVMVSL